MFLVLAVYFRKLTQHFFELTKCYANVLNVGTNSRVEYWLLWWKIQKEQMLLPHFDLSNAAVLHLVN